MLQSALKAFADLFRPKVLSFMVGVPLLALGLWGLGGVVLLPLLNHLFLDLLSYLQIQALLQGFFGPEAFSQGASVTLLLILLLLLFPLVYWTSLLLMSFVAMPYILKILRRQYPDAFLPKKKIPRIQEWGLMLGVFYVAVPAYILLLLLIWIPAVYAAGTFILGAWVNVHFLSYEILAECAERPQIRKLMRESRGEMWIMGCALMLLLGVPFLQLITPVYGGLWFSHWWLQRLNNKSLVALDGQT